MSHYFCLPFSTHPLRADLYDELHARPFQMISAPRQMTHLAFRAEPAEMTQAFELICDLCRRYSVNQPTSDEVSYQQDFGEFTVRWEKHMEFYSLTFSRGGPINDPPFEHPVIGLLPTDWLSSLPGQAVSAFHIIVDDGQLTFDHENLTRIFEGQRLMMSQPKQGKAIICTAFRLHSDGFGRFMVQNRGISDYQMGRLIQRIIELETYRLLAQLSLPLAKRIAPQLQELDRELAEMLTHAPTEESAEADRIILERLSRLSGRLEMWRAETNHRFSATRAYHDLVLSRLQNIKEDPIEGYMTFTEFMTRRLNPGLRTCESVQSWMEDLSRRIERAGDMMRTRVNLMLQDQNKDLLATMNRRGRLQFRLQETVEGLSVAAISYYMVGLLSYLLDGLPLGRWNLEKNILLAVLVPVVVIVIWGLIRRVKHRLIKQPKHQV